MKPTLPIALLTAAIALAGCETTPADKHDHAHMHNAPNAAQHANSWASVKRAVAVLYPTRGNQVSGTLVFDQTPQGVLITGSVTGLEPKSVHAMHIHEFGDPSAVDGASAGAHYNPEKHPHAGPTTPERHAGDLGNITADDAGKATINLTFDNISLTDLKNPILGRGVVVHAQKDDFTTPNTGNAGARIAVGVIGIAKNNP